MIKERASDSDLFDSRKILKYWDEISVGREDSDIGMGRPIYVNWSTSREMCCCSSTTGPTGAAFRAASTFCGLYNHNSMVYMNVSPQVVGTSWHLGRVD
jgi:hypothetical protein